MPLLHQPGYWNDKGPHLVSLAKPNTAAFDVPRHVCICHPIRSLLCHLILVTILFVLEHRTGGATNALRLRQGHLYQRHVCCMVAEKGACSSSATCLVIPIETQEPMFFAEATSHGRNCKTPSFLLFRMRLNAGCCNVFRAIDDYEKSRSY